MYYLFLLNPFFSLLVSLQDLRKRHAKNILWLFVVFIGVTWTLRPDSTVDSVRYAENVSFLHYSDFSFLEYQKYRGDVDFFSNGLTFLLSRFTSSGSALIIAQSVIFGFFFSRNMHFVYSKMSGSIRPIAYIMFLAFFFVMPMWTFNGFRFNLATHVFVYGLLHYFFDGKKLFLIWCFVTPIVFHYAFGLPSAVLLLYLLIGNRTTLFFGLFIFSLFFAEFDIKTFNQYFEKYVPQDIQERSSGYRSEGGYEKKQERESQGVFGGSASWHALLYQKSLFWTIDIFLILFYVRRKKIIKTNSRFISLLSFALLYGAFANFLVSLPSGQRYSVVLSLFAMALIVVYFHNAIDDILALRLGYIVAPMLVFFIIVSARQGLYFTSLTTILGNPIVALFSIGENINLDLIIKGQ